jgi:hypothetical protein
VDGEVRALVLLPLALVFALPALTSDAGGADAKKRCRVVVKRVHGHKKRVRVCTRPKPKPKPKPNPVPHFFKRVDVGGYKLAIGCTGTGSPAIVLDSGFNTSRSAWLTTTRRLVFRTMRVCSYDRAGLGQSDNRPKSITPTTGRIVDELHTLLSGANVGPPYVLGGWSIGGFDVRYYQKRYPAEVAGLVLVDASPPAFLLESPEPLEGEFETMYTHAAAADLQPPPSLGSLPLVDVIRGVGLDDLWIAAHKQIARTSTNSILVRANGASHDIPGDNPQLVAGALKLVLGAVRRGESLPPCLNANYGGACLDPN